MPDMPLQSLLDELSGVGVTIRRAQPFEITPWLCTVPGTDYDMDVNVFNRMIEELRSKWPFTNEDAILRRVATDKCVPANLFP